MAQPRRFLLTPHSSRVTRHFFSRRDAMRLAEVFSRAQCGLDAPLVRVEVHLAGGLPSLGIVGLPETAVKESKDRVRSAIVNSGFDFPRRRITVNLAPADLPKEGGRVDLSSRSVAICGELSGHYRPRLLLAVPGGRQLCQQLTDRKWLWPAAPCCLAPATCSKCADMSAGISCCNSVRRRRVSRGGWPTLILPKLSANIMRVAPWKSRRQVVTAC